MHREFDSTESPFRPRSNGTLYLITGLLAALLIGDLWPQLAKWLSDTVYPTPTWATTDIFGFRFALIVAVLGGARVLYGSLEKLSEGRVGADLAIAIACVAAILIGQPLVAAEVVFIGLVGECLEAFTFDRTQRALGKLTELFPQRCWVIRDGVESRVLTSAVVVGDTVVVKPGGRVPVDGVVMDGRTEVDSSALTGESLPVEKTTGDTILAGSIVLHGALTIRAVKIDKQTVAGTVIELTAQALKTKSKGERQADRFARYFLPIVLGIALAVFLANVGYQYFGTQPDGQKISLGAASRVALYPALAVLVVACPCPLVLATPAAVIAALGRLAGTGVLIKSGAALERLAEVKGFAFDKTGTLTEGKLELGDIRPAPNIPESELLEIAGIAEIRSEHAIARVVLAEVTRRGLVNYDSDSFTAFPGGGACATSGDWAIVVGTRRFLTEQGIPDSTDADDALKHFDETGQTPLLVARNGKYLGAIGARDRLRPEAPGVLADLAALGLQPLILLSGDRAAVARTVGDSLGLADVHGELLPAQKAEAIRALGQPMAFVGDGINDAPALAGAHVGIAIGTGTYVAAHAGDVIMMGEPLRPLPMLVRLSRETAKVIRQNIVWFGFGVNFVGILLTGVLWPLFATSPEWYEIAPLAGAIYHQLGSLLVLLNSMRLLAFERTATNAVVGRARDATKTVDRWINTLHADDLLHAVTHRWKPVLGGVIAVSLLGWLASGFTAIAANEVGVVQRFGAVQNDLPPGLHVRWPWPIEAVTRVKPAEVRTVEIGFRMLSEEKIQQLELARYEQNKLRQSRGQAGDGGLTWSSAHAEGIARQTDESLMLTGDGDLIELLATIRYTIDDPRGYIFASKNPDAVLRSVAEAVFRELIAARSFQNLLGTGRPEFERAAQIKLAERLKEAAPGGLGVRIDGLTIHDLHPPQEVVGAYHAVADAIQKRDTAVNTAASDAARTKARASDDSLRTVRSAEAEAYRRTAEATAARDVMLGWQAARSRLTPEEDAKLNAEIEERVKLGQPRDAVTADVNARRQQLIAARRALTDFRLGLAAITAVLRTRDKILVDADKLPGTRKLYLIDPDLMPRLQPGVPLAFPRAGDQREKDP